MTFLYSHVGTVHVIVFVYDYDIYDNHIIKIMKINYNHMIKQIVQG